MGFIKPPRNPNFSALTSKHVERLTRMLSHPNSRTHVNPDALERYNTDWMRQAHGAATLALCPSTTQEVANVMQYCNEHRIAVCPQGGNTGLVYGSNPIHDEVVVSLERMNAAPSIHSATMSATCEAGVILQVLQEDAKKHGMLAPLDMGSKGSCFIGGNLATNAGGIHFARYGSIRSNCLGLEVVTPQGDILDMMSCLRKDNAGYDMKQLFIGSEGTLGIITKAEVKLYPHPKSMQLAMLQVGSFADVLKTYACATRSLSECLSAFEVIDAEALTCDTFEGYPFQHKPGTFTILVETHGADSNHDFEKLGNFVQACEDDHIQVIEQVLSQSEEQTRKLWKIREDVPVKLAQSGTIYKFDVSFPLHQFYDIVEYVRKAAREERRLPEHEVLIVGYGHFGDGNVHLNVVDKTRGKHAAVLESIMYPGVYRQTAIDLHGSVSAEHGIGMQKKDFLPLSRKPAVVSQMKRLKGMMDPNGILNPYKVL